MHNLLITGGAGFIGSNFVEYLFNRYPDYRVVVYDKLTYAGRLENLERFQSHHHFTFVQGDIADPDTLGKTIEIYAIDTLVNFAAETHVDRSIMAPDAFIHTDVHGTYVLLEAVKAYQLERALFVSTDEVYGHIPHGMSSVEDDALKPRSPYAASKAGGEHLVYAYHITYNLPVIVTRGTNNIGPYQYPEKAVPLFITNAIDDIPLPIYGDGRQMRDYQYVMDHCEGIDVALHHGHFGEAYNIGSGVETENMVMAHAILDLLGKPHSLIQHVTDRAGHDRRYSVKTDKISTLGWQSQHTFEEAIEKTVRWYVGNQDWWRPLKSGEYLDYYRKQYVERGSGSLTA
ncbi:MAG: dTDP-glucose 4,6-dehydratase [Chloroflexi bacterium AL-W]|nr:dTDP-glucose 4,6-dehydratase [Chloroflexi bacterium AL-N1]NOK70606.1 dTDP-glucose 4,6-dehydratase [Chloroflexi bacterium AL-N10]NOK77598.1 dTDP-glucose 4,6-dehydratase [Chloroflexi bacterium AL-N5]NOK84449.1 dTDP-glucose 4,6-dehydratase [Chloroflexi bacterium AL-W]NOK92338.1 dTDP-glucose 4,6-dehydratase [Chloroflexi bacterium AL-N15]